MPKSKALVKSEPVQTLTVYDEENQKYIEVNREIQVLAAQTHQEVLMGVFTSAVAIKKMFDNKLYLGLGYQSREDYIANGLPIARRQAYAYYQIASKMDSAVKLLRAENAEFDENSNPVVHSSALTQNTEQLLPNENGWSELGKLGVKKLYEITTLEDDELATLLKSGKVSLDGGDIDLNELIDLTAKQVAQKVAAARKRDKAEISRLSEKIKLTESEQKDRAKLVDQLSKENGDAKKIEAMYGPKASLIKDKFERVSMARTLLNEFAMTTRNCGVDENDPAELRNELRTLLKSISELHEELTDAYMESIGDVE